MNALPSPTTTARLARRLVPLLLVALGAGCVTRGATADADSFEAGGVFVRHLRVRLAPHDTLAFEAWLERCVAVATRSGLSGDSEWLCYREPPGRYWILAFAETADGFAAPPGLAGFVDHVASAAGDATRRELTDELRRLEHEVEHELVCRQRTDWGTVDEMYTATHPEARMILRTIRPGMEAEFAAALTARTAFLRAHGYPLPVEGFVILGGAPGQALQVVFPRDWSSFHDSESFYAFSRTKDEAMQAEYAVHKAALLETMARAEYLDGSFAAELSFDGI